MSELVKVERIRETEVFKRLRGSIRIQILRHFQTVSQLRRAFGKDGSKLRGLPNIGIRSFNVLCQILGRYDCIKYDVVNGICQVCGSDIVPFRQEYDEEKGKYKFGYLCDCDEITRGQTK